MRRPLISVAATIGTGLALAACGGSSGGTAGSSASASTPTATRQIAGIGQVLVNAGGEAVYTNDQERRGAVICTGACTAFWKPVAPGARTTPVTAAGARLGVVKRPDGTTQLTENGRPLYTFSEDSPGTAKGDNFNDDFGDHHFTWHVVRLAAATPDGAQHRSTTTGATGNQPSPGYPGY